MKKLFIIMLLASSLSAFAQEKNETANHMAVGFGLEWNMNARHYYAGGTSISFDYKLPNHYAIGVIVTGSTNFFGFSVIEPTILLRGYIQKDEYQGLFLQIDVGPFIIFEKGKIIPMFEIGARGGYRFIFGSSFYVEPYGRLGIPFAFGIGAIAGICF